MRTDISISNIFKLRPESTLFQVNANVTDFVVEEWGDDTVGHLQYNDAALLTDKNPMVLGMDEARMNLSRKFDLKLERRFPKTRFGGNCVLTRLGHKL